jgi:hypothetical protein
VEGPCEHGNEPPGSIKCWEVLEWLHNWQLLKKGSAPCSFFYLVCEAIGTAASPGLLCQPKVIVKIRRAKLN